MSTTLALLNLRPNSRYRWVGTDYADLEWFDDESLKPTWEELLTESERIQTERIANLYQNKRAMEYPSIEDFADAYYWAQKGDTTLMDAYVAKCDAVKDKYPKP